MAVDVADAAEAGDDFLADIAAFGGANGIGFEASFGGEGVGSDVDAPEGKSAGDAERFPFGQGGGVGLVGGGGGNPQVEARFTKAGAEEMKGIFWRIGGWRGEG